LAVEEGIGYHDEREQFHYGPDPKLHEYPDCGDVNGEIE